MSMPAEQHLSEMSRQRREDHARYLAAMTEEERAAYARGRAEFPCGAPGDDRFVLNPYDADDEPALYAAWQAGFDSA